MDQIFVNLKSGILEILGNFLPEWAVIVGSIKISIIAFLILGPFTMMYLTLLERKVVGRMQNRIGPNRVGKWGLLQPFADGVKMLTKEDIVPEAGDKLLHFLAPVLIIIPALLVFSVVPFGRNMTAIDLNIGLLFFLAVSSTTAIPIFMAAWGSRNKYSVIGGMRSVAQMISYEIPMVISVVPVILMSESLSTNTIVEAQTGAWYIFTPWGILGFLIFFLCGVAEVNRSPFDLPEAESEIIAGFHTEYSGMKFAIFYMAEFMNAFTVCGLAVTLFLGGWNGPILPSWIWFFIKTYALIFIMIWFRGTLPRFRVDQMMGLAWKFLLPLALINIFTAGLWHFTGPVLGWIICSLILIIGFMGLSQLNQKYRLQKRTYRFES